MCVSLVLEGGGASCAYTCGVLDVLMDNNIFIQRTYTVSDGTCSALNYLSKQRGRSFELFCRYTSKKRNIHRFTFRKKNHYYSFDPAFDKTAPEIIPFNYSEFFKTRMELYVGTTDCQTGEPVFFGFDKKDEHFTTIAASFPSLMASHIFSFSGRQLFDGSFSVPIPIEQALEDGCTHNIIVMTQKLGCAKSPKYDLSKIIFDKELKQYPNLIEVMHHRHDIYNKEIQLCCELEKQGRTIVIAPSKPITSGRYECRTEKLHEIYNMGLSDAKASLQKLQRFIALNDCNPSQEILPTRTFSGRLFSPTESL